MQVPFSEKAEQNEDVTQTQDVKPAALSAFLNPPSRLINFNQKNQLSPQQISQKVASLLKPGPPFYSEVSSSDLIENLSNGSLMRCDELRQQIEKDAARKKDNKGWFKGAKVNAQQEGEEQHQVQPWTGVGTVWSALDSLPSGNAVFAVPAVSADGKIETTSTKNDQGDDGLWSAIMFSCDLDGKNVELTKSCVVPTHVLNTHHYYNGNKSALFASIGAGSTYKWDDWSNEQSANVSVASLLALYTNPTLEAWQWPSWVPFLGKKDDDKDGKPTPKPEQPKGSKRVWVPSTTKVSVRANWWGYTIYIPQSVFPNLDSDVEQAEKIANIVHTVLTTILDKASSLPIPAALQAALLVLKAIAPSTSYISTFIGWSWDEIKSFNKGQGVELSATWLLPIALIPHTWDAAVAPPDQNGDGKPDGPPTTQPPATVPQTGGNTDQPASSQPQTGGDSDQPAPSQPQTGSDNDQPAPSQPQPVEPTPTVPAPADPAPEKPNPKAPQTDAPQPAVPVSDGPKQEEPASKQPPATEPVTAEPTAPQIPAQSPQEHATLPSAPSTTTPPASVQPAVPVPAPAPAPAPTPAPQAPSNDDNTISGDPLGRGKLGLPSIGDAPAQTPAAENDGIEWQGQPAEPAAPAATTSSTTEPAELAITELSTTDAKSSEKVKDGKRKLFGKISNRV